MDCRKRRVKLTGEDDEPHREPDETKEEEADDAASSSIPDVDPPGTNDPPVGVGWTGTGGSPTPPLTPTSSLRSVTRARSLSPDGKACSSPARDEQTKRLKRKMILKALDRSPPDVATLRQLAISRGGLLDNSLRQRAWPTLLDIDVTQIPTKPDEETLHGHRDYQQVVLDVNRSIKRFPPGMLEEVRMSYQDQLIDCIMWVLVSHPDLHYYQGFHDVVVTFLLVIGEELTFAVMDRLTQNHLRDFMEVTMEKTNYILNYLLPIIGRASPDLRDFLERSEVGNVFCLSWLITWYGHVLSDFKDIVRLYDFFIACDPLMPIYLAADIVLFREKEVLACPCEMPFVHKLLSKIPDTLPFELLIIRAGDLFILYPPYELEDEARQQYERHLEAIRQRREEIEALKEARKSAARARSRAPERKETSLLVKVTVCTLIGALSAIAITMLRNGARPDWQAWLWT